MPNPLQPDSGAYSVERYRALLADTPPSQLEEVHAAVWPRLSAEVRRAVLVEFARRAEEEESGGGGGSGAVAAGAGAGYAAVDHLFDDLDADPPGAHGAVATRGPQPAEPAEQDPGRT